MEETTASSRTTPVRWRIRYQLLVPLLTLLLGVAGVSTWTALAAAERARQQIETRVRDVADYLSEDRSFPLSQKILEDVKKLSGADYLLVRQAGGPLQTFATSDVQAPPPETVQDDWQALHLGSPVVVEGRTYLCSGFRLPQGPDRGNTLFVFYPEALWRDAQWEAVWPSLVLGGSVGLASVALAVGVGQRLGRRIHELERRTRLIAAGDFSPLPLPARDDEIRDLARSVNEMAQRLAQLQEAVQRAERMRLLGQVSGGLAHQLRNSLTGARLAVQLYARESAGQTDTAALDVALRQLTLMETNLKRFLDLGRTGPGRREPCSLAALVGEAVDLLRPRCRHAGIDLRWQPPPTDGVVLGDAGQLGQLVLNLLTNAVEAAGPGGWVAARIEVRGLRIEKDRATLDPRTSQPIVLEVIDSGPGPSPEVAGRLFEPFVTGKPEGVGLGLAVARQVAEAHGGRIAWRREKERTVFRVELPMEGTGTPSPSS
jgi:signal transduction histidine kinase